MIKWSVLALIMFAIVLVVAWLVGAPEELAERSQSKLRLKQAEYAVGEMDLELIDNARSTPALGGYEGDDKRVLKGVIWFPKGGSKAHPLLVFSHGFGGHHKDSTHIAEYLASNGYVVASMDFPLSNMNAPTDVPQLVDVVDQPGDVSAVIDHVLALTSDATSQLYQRVDSTKIGVMGLSLGGLTTALVSFHPDLKDQRVKAAVMMAPPLEAFSEQFFANNIAVKSLLISGSFDRVVPEFSNATQVQARHPDGWFLSLDKGTHLGFADIGNPIRWMDNPDDLGCIFMDIALEKLDLPERWDAVLPNTGGVLRDIVVGPPCPEIDGEAMNGLKQQWLTRIAIGSFFDMHLYSGARAEAATEFFSRQLSSENSEASLTLPR